MSDSSVTGNLPLSGATDLQAQSAGKETQEQQTVTVGGRTYKVKNNNLPTKNVSEVVGNIKADLSNMGPTSQKNVEKYAKGRADVATKKVEKFDKILSTPLLGKIVQKIATLLSVILPKQIQPGQLQDIKFAKEWKKEITEFGQLADEATRAIPAENRDNSLEVNTFSGNSLQAILSQDSNIEGVTARAGTVDKVSTKDSKPTGKCSPPTFVGR